MIDDPKNRKIFLVQELMEGGALMPDSEKCDAMANEVREEIELSFYMIVTYYIKILIIYRDEIHPIIKGRNTSNYQQMK